jgi:hypothetical protein
LHTEIFQIQQKGFSCETGLYFKYCIAFLQIPYTRENCHQNNLPSSQVQISLKNSSDSQASDANVGDGLGAVVVVPLCNQRGGCCFRI